MGSRLEMGSPEQELGWAWAVPEVIPENDPSKNSALVRIVELSRCLSLACPNPTCSHPEDLVSSGDEPSATGISVGAGCDVSTSSMVAGDREVFHLALGISCVSWFSKIHHHGLDTAGWARVVDMASSIHVP